MIFNIFHKNNHFRNEHFQENSQNLIEGEFVNIREITLVIIFMIFPQKWLFRLEIENFWNVLEFSLIMFEKFLDKLYDELMNLATYNIEIMYFYRGHRLESNW